MQLADFGAWKAARELAAEIYRVTRDGPFSADATLRLETRDRAVSVMTNLAASCERSGCDQVRQCLADAAGSAGELDSLLYLAEDAGFLAAESVDRLQRQVAAVRRHIDSVRRAVDRFESLTINEAGS
jgi:four helix bundle protein